jgi:hypothetical protein
MARRSVLGLWPRRAALIVDTFLADDPRPLPVNLSERLDDSGMPKFNGTHCYEPGPHYEPGHMQGRGRFEAGGAALETGIQRRGSRLRAPRRRSDGP